MFSTGYPHDQSQLVAIGGGDSNPVRVRANTDPIYRVPARLDVVDECQAAVLISHAYVHTPALAVSRPDGNFINDIQVITNAYVMCID